MGKEVFDAVVIGSGCAGFNVADELWKAGVKNIAIITEGIKKGTSRNTGSDKQTYYKLSLAGDTPDSVKNMAETLFEGGAMNGDVALCEAANSVRGFMKLVSLGVEFPTNEAGEFVGYKTDHDPSCRATSIGPYTSKRMTEVLENEVLKKNIKIFDKTRAVKILTENGRAVGIIALDLYEKSKISFKIFQTPNVILATGGPADIYEDVVYPTSQTGSSSLALDAGATFANLAEWQYGIASTKFRWNLSGTYQQVLPKYISVDKDGVKREFLLQYFESPAEMLKNVFLKGYEWPFDSRKTKGSSQIDFLVYRESVVLGRRVFMDFTEDPTGLEDGFGSLDETAKNYLNKSDALVRTPIERLHKMNPGAIALYKEHGIDLETEPVEIAVCAQHNNGGVMIDSDWQSDVKGLYAVGEAAGSLGIFRPGGTALNSCMVGGFRIANSIAYHGDFTECVKFDEIAENEVKTIVKQLECTRKNHADMNEQRRRLQSRMSRDFAFLRDVESMKKTFKEIKEDAKNAEKVISWSKISDLDEYFTEIDIIKMQEAAALSMLYTAEKFGGRGGALVKKDDAEVQENHEGRSRIVTVKKDGRISAADIPVRCIPERELWFEKAWKNFRNERRM